MPSFFSNVAAHAKAHHESVNAAYASYYGAGASRSNTPATSPMASPRNSLNATSPMASLNATPEASRNNSVAVQAAPKKAPTNVARAWKAIKKQHHEMNEAFAMYYGRGQVHR